MQPVGASSGPVLRENLRRAAECALAGVLWTVFSLPLLTAGGAWAAIAEICAAWQRGEEPGLLRTFAAVVRREFGGGLLMMAAGLAAGAIPILELRVALAGHLPGARVEAVALAVVGGVTVSLILLAFPQRAATGEPWPACLRSAAALAAARLWVVPLTVAAVGIAGLLVVVCPPLAVIIAGPAGYAVSAIYSRACAGRG